MLSTAAFFFGLMMVTPIEWVSEKAKSAKRALGFDPEGSRLQGEMKTAEQERNYREQNYFGNPRSKFQTKKPKPIRVKSKRVSSGRVDFGRQ